jgi:hypothetical protein
MTSFHVDPAVLDKYAEKLTGDKDLVTEVSGLVAQSDVGNESWGVVGIFVKSSYTSMLGDLNLLLGDMKDGLDAGAEKMTLCADTYRAIDGAIATIFDGVLQEGE